MMKCPFRACSIARTDEHTFATNRLIPGILATKVAKYGVHVIIPIYASGFERVEALNNTNLFSDLWIVWLMQRIYVQLHNNSYGDFDKMDFYECYIYTRSVSFHMYNKRMVLDCETMFLVTRVPHM